MSETEFQLTADRQHHVLIPNSLSGGEFTGLLAERRAALGATIKAEPDVFALLELSYQGAGKWLYLIQTPFATYPKFVIGETTDDNESPEPLVFFGAEWSARNEWLKLNGGEH